jgi:hypothetical protein
MNVLQATTMTFTGRPLITKRILSTSNQELVGLGLEDQGCGEESKCLASKTARFLTARALGLILHRRDRHTLPPANHSNTVDNELAWSVVSSVAVKEILGMSEMSLARFPDFFGLLSNLTDACVYNPHQKTIPFFWSVCKVRTQDHEPVDTLPAGRPTRSIHLSCLQGDGCVGVWAGNRILSTSNQELVGLGLEDQGCGEESKCLASKTARFLTARALGLSPHELTCQELLPYGPSDSQLVFHTAAVRLTVLR